LATDRQTNKQMDSSNALTRYRERRLNNAYFIFWTREYNVTFFEIGLTACNIVVIDVAPSSVLRFC